MEGKFVRDTKEEKTDMLLRALMSINNQLGFLNNVIWRVLRSMAVDHVVTNEQVLAFLNSVLKGYPTCMFSKSLLIDPGSWDAEFERGVFSKEPEEKE